MELQIRKPETASVRVVEMKNKPLMALAMENVKLRDYPQDLKVGNTANLIDWLLNFLGVNAKGEQVDHHTELAKHILDCYGSWTFQEMKLAFEMYAQGKFNEQGKPMLVTQQLNAVVFGKVMRSYEEIKKNELTVYYQKRNRLEEPQMTQEEKDAIVYTGAVNCFEHFKQDNYVANGYVWVYDHLDELDLINFDKQEKLEAMQRAKEVLELEAKQNTNAISAKKILQEIEKKNSSAVVVKAKILLLEKFFRTLVKNKLEIKNMIK